MATIPTIKLDTRELMKNVSIEVDVVIVDPPLMRLRRGVAIGLIRLAAFLLNVNIEVNVNGNDAH